MICGRSLRFVTRSNCTQRFFLRNRLRFLCGNDTVAVAMHFAMKNGQLCFSLRKFLAISPAIQKIASDCGCDAVVHLGATELIASARKFAVRRCPSTVWCTVPNCESASFRWIPCWEGKQEGNRFKALQGGISSSECGSEVFRVWLTRVSGDCPSTVVLLTWFKNKRGKHRPNSTPTPSYYRRVTNAALVNAALVLSSKNINSVQTRCIVKGEAQKSPLFWRFSRDFDFLRVACSLGIPQENL